MDKRYAGLTVGAIALLGIGVVIGLAVSRTAPHQSDAKVTAPQAIATDATVPDTYRALRDLLGVSSSGSLREVPGQRAVFWSTYGFDYKGASHHVVFFSLKRFDSSGQPETCRACIPELAAVTYRRSANGWEVAAKDLGIGRVGAYGEPPAAAISALALGETPAVIVDDSGTSQGFTATWKYLMAYRDGWKFLGTVQTGQGNTGATECVQDRRCYSWQGNMKVLNTESNGFPDLAIERQGMQEEEPGGKLVPAATVKYHFTGTVYYEKGKTPPPPAVPASPQAQTPAAQPESATASPPAPQWYAADVNFTRCIRSRSPADRIRMIQEYGKSPRVTDLQNGAVEVAEQTTTSDEQVWTYYPSEEACTAALPRSQPIPSRYR